MPARQCFSCSAVGGCADAGGVEGADVPAGTCARADAQKASMSVSANENSAARRTQLIPLKKVVTGAPSITLASRSLPREASALSPSSDFLLSRCGLCRRQRMGRKPKPSRRGSGVNCRLLPPRGFIATAMDLTMMATTERHRELASESARLGKAWCASHGTAAQPRARGLAPLLDSYDCMRNDKLSLWRT
jgi:hypothetical protein